MPDPTLQTFDVLIIGAGLSGVCSLHHIRERFPSWRVGVLEAGSDVGGTWYWNRYPGARIDTESLSYQYSFDKELLDEWNWDDEFSTQPKMREYIQRVAQKHDLYRDIQFHTKIESAHWNDAERTWTFVDTEGNKYKTTFFISCLGFLSSPTLPAIPGIDTFKGQSFHTSRWPADLDMNTDFANKRIGLIGTGATGIQTSTAISKLPNIASLSVFQRTANWSAPLRNAEITPAQMEQHKKEYDTIFKRCSETTSGFLHAPDPRKCMEVSPEERLELWEKLYNSPGFGKWLGVFSDTYTDREANALYSKFIADKIRQRVHDPETAASLIPQNHGFGTRRVPLESGYFEAFNQPHINLVDLKKTPADHITDKGIVTADGKLHELDVLIYATGFDAITGAFSAIDWHAKDDRPLVATSDTKAGQRAIWPDHRPTTYLGLAAPAMPNMFMVLGPHQLLGNATRSIEHAVDVISDLLEYCKERNYTYVEPKQEAVDGWDAHVVECSKAGVLVNEVDSWMTGINTNVKGKNVKSVARYTGSQVVYRKRCADEKASGYKSLIFA